MPISNPKETIDERVLGLIGLEDVFDLDYETYRLLLKEVLVKNSLGKVRIPDEERDLLVSELKKYHGSGKKGRFEVKKKKITAASFDVGNIKGVISGTKSTKVLPESISSGSPISKSLEDNITAIASSVVSIAETLKQQQKIKDSTKEYNRRKEEQEKRALSESKLEKSFQGLKKIAERIISPVKSLLDRIIQFFTTIILGRIVYKLVEWLADPGNANKVKSVIRFLGDWWPALLGSYILFGTSFGKLIRFTLGWVGRFVFQIGKFAIPKLLSVIKNPYFAVPAAFAGMGVLANEVTGQRKAAPVQAENKAKAQTGRGLGVGGVGGVGDMGPTTPYGLLQAASGGGLLRAFSGGGFASGYVSGEKGVDKVPAMLSDGEFVMSRGAVEKYGVDTLESMNAAGGGTNKPKIINGKTYAAGGGLVGNAEYYVNEILRGLAPKYTWAEKLARQAGVQAQQRIGQFGQSVYDSALTQGVRAQSYLTRGGLEKDVNKMMQAGTQFGAGLYDQALKVGNKALSDIQSGKVQKKVSDTLSQASQIPKKSGVGFFDTMKNISSSETYKKGAQRMEGAQDKMISLGDKFINKLPDGPFKEMADKGLIPIPSGNATIMRNLTFAKALLGPLGRPFKILSNKEVDEMRRKTIEKTMNKSGLMVDPKTGQVKMNWNQEDINKGAKGGGAYTDNLGARGSAFNSILGRFSASTEGKGNTLYSDDRYNFNRTVAEYADLAKKGLLKGSMSDATYYGASMLGRFAQDIGWLNQRALGSRIKIGTIDKNRLNPATGRYMSNQQALANKKRQEEMKLGGGSVKLYDKPKKNTGESYKSRFARPRNAGVRPVRPPSSRPRVVYGPPVPSSSRRGGGRRSTGNGTPRFSPTTRGWRSKRDTLGLMR